MRVCFRVDASIQIGSGHVMRCMTLANGICDKGATVSFISRAHPGHLCDLIERKGFPVVRLPESHPANSGLAESARRLGATREEDLEQTKRAIRHLSDPIDWLIVDHYSLDAGWETQLRSLTRKIMVIDDLADRPHDCDLLLDQNYYRNLETRYDGLTPPGCRKLLGPSYVLLRNEFQKIKHLAKVRDGRVTRILVFLGGSDPENFTAKVLGALDQVNRSDITIDVVVGASNIHRSDIENICRKRPKTNFHFQVDNLAELMLGADLAIGAGGATTWERCLLGLPTLTIVIADNQLQTTLDLDAVGIIWYLGIADKLGVTDLAEAIFNALSNPMRLREMSARAIQFMNSQKNFDINPVVSALIESA